MQTSAMLWSGSSVGQINGTWTNDDAINTINKSLGLTGDSALTSATFRTGSSCYYTAAGSSTSTLTVRLSPNVVIGSEITFFVAATARGGKLTNFSSSGLQGGSTSHAVNSGSGFVEDDDSFSEGNSGGAITFIQYTGTVGEDRTVTFSSTTNKNGWQMLAYNMTSLNAASYLTWNGTSGSSVWDTSSKNWVNKSNQGASFQPDSYVRFTSDAAEKTVQINSDIAAGAIDVLDDYTFSFGENSSLSFTSLDILYGKTLTKDGAGTWALGGTTITGHLKVTEGRVTSSGIFDGNVTVTAGGNITSSGAFNGSVTVTGGNIKLESAASINGGLTINGGNVTYSTSSNDANNKFAGGVSIQNGTLTINAKTNGNDKSIIKSGSTVSIGEAGKLVLNGHDLIGWKSNQAPANIILQGKAGENAEDEPKYAVLDIRDTVNNNSFTFAAPLKLKGYTKVIGTEFNTNGSAITISAEGSDNTITNTIKVNNQLTVGVAEQGSLTFAGGLSDYDEDKVIQKTNSGTLIISGSGIKYRGVINVEGGTLHAASDISISKVSVTNGSSLTVGAGKTTTITSDAAAGGLVLNPAGTSKVILEGQPETVTAGGKLVYDEFTYQASGETDAEIIGNKDTAFNLQDAFKSISNATIALNSGASEAKEICGGDTAGVLNNVTLSNNSIHDLTVLSTAAGKLSIINDDGDTSSTGTGTIIDKTVKTAATTPAEGDTSSTDSFESYDRVHAITGNVELYKTGATVSVADMVIGDSHSISAYQGEDTTNQAKIVVSESLTTMGQSTELNANLSLDGTTLTLNDGALTLNGSLSMSGVKLVATDYMQWNSAKSGDVLKLFEGVTSVTGFSDDADASTVFSNLRNGDFKINYITDGGIVQLVATRDVPEPATVTLSLLALAALVSRRRRKV